MYLLLVLLSCCWIMKACDPFEESADFLGRNMKAGIKGATINAAASSIPEFLTTIIFLFFYHDKAGFASGVGTTAGSAVFNAMVIPAFAILAVIIVLKKSDFNLSRACILRDGAFLITAEIILIILLSNSIMEWWHGMILVSIYGAYMTFIAIQSIILNGNDNSEDDDEDDANDEFEENNHNWLVNFYHFDYRNMLRKNKKFTTKTALIAIFLSVVHISGACYLLAECVVNMAEILNMNTFFVAVIVAAAATSVPDTVISFRDAMKGNYDDSISNAVGSNIFDICICLGLPLSVYAMLNGPIEIPQSAGITELRLILLVFTVLVIALLLLPKIGIKTAMIFISGYLFYATYSLCRGMDMPWAVEFGSYVTKLSNYLM